MRSTERKHVIELFARSDRRARELVNRLFRLHLQNCVVVLRRLPQSRAADTNGRPFLTIDGQPLPLDDDGRIGTAILRRAVEGQAVG